MQLLPSSGVVEYGDLVLNVLLKKIVCGKGRTITVKWKEIWQTLF